MSRRGNDLGGGGEFFGVTVVAYHETGLRGGFFHLLAEGRRIIAGVRPVVPDDL